jgi:hypothetical protein
MENTGATQDKGAELAAQLGIGDDWRGWVVEFGADVVTAVLVALDCDTLPFMGEG